MSVELLVKKVKTLDNGLVVKAVLPKGETVEISSQQYVVEGDYHMFARKEGVQFYDRLQTVGGLKSNLEYEASDSCWRTRGELFDDAISDFLDCTAYVVTGDYDAFLDGEEKGYACYEVYGVLTSDNELYLICDDENDKMKMKCKECTMKENCIAIPEADECDVRKNAYNQALDDFEKEMLEWYKQITELRGGEAFFTVEGIMQQIKNMKK